MVPSAVAVHAPANVAVERLLYGTGLGSDARRRFGLQSGRTWGGQPALELFLVGAVCALDSHGRLETARSLADGSPMKPRKPWQTCPCRY